jgi:hypothetical protein
LRGPAAIGVRGAAVEHQNRRAIALAVLGEDLLPLQLGAAEHLAHETAYVVLGSASASRRRRRLHLRLALAAQDLGPADEQAWIDAERPADQAERDDRADAQSATADRQAEPSTAAAETAVVASIFDVAAFRQIVQPHGFASLPAGRAAAPSPDFNTARINAPWAI